MRSTAVGELVCCALFPAMAFGFAGAPRSVANVTGTVVVIVLLLQGAAYWFLKARHLDGRSAADDWVGPFARLRTLDRWLLLLSLVVIVASIAVDGLAQGWVGLAFWVLALLEHVNYFHVQLMYDNRADLAWLVRHGPKRAALA